MKKNVPWHIPAPRRGCFSNHLPLRRVRILAELFLSYGNEVSYTIKKRPSTENSAKGRLNSNAVPPLFTACAASRLLTKSYPVTGITRENLRPEYPVSALRLGSYLPHSCLEAAFQRIHAAALSGKGICVLLFVIAFNL